MKVKIPDIVKTLLILSPVLLIMAFLLITFLKPGYIISTDVTEGLDVSRLYQRYIYTYSNDIGEALAEKARIPLFYLIYTLFKATSLGDSYYVKIKFLTLIVTTIISFFVSFKIILNTKPSNHLNKTSFLIAAVGGSLFYILNYWSTNRLIHFYLFFSTVSVSITFAILYSHLFGQAKTRKLVILALILAGFSATPHAVLLILLTALAVIISYLLRKDSMVFAQKLNILLRILPIIIVYALVNLYWILPFLTAKSNPDAYPSLDIVAMLSKNSNLLNTLLLKGYWWENINEYNFKQTVVFNIVNHLSSIIPLALMGIVLYVKRKSGYSIALLISIIIGTLFSSRNIISQPFYEYLMFNSPLKDIGWLFREYDKIGLILAFCYAVSISLLLYECYAKKKFRILISVAVLISLLNPLLYFSKTLSKYYISQYVPNDFFEVNNILEMDKSEFNVAWYPEAEKTNWIATREGRFIFSNLISKKPAITTRSDLIYYLEYIFDQNNIDDINISKALDIIGVKYLIIRKDDSLNPYKNYLIYNIKNRPGLNVLYNSDLLTVYINNNFSGLVKIYDTKITTNKGLEILKYLDSLNVNTSSTFIEFTDTNYPIENENLKTIYKLDNGEYIDIAINSFKEKFIFPADFTSYVESGRADKWRKSSLKNINHANNRFFFLNYGLDISQFDYDNMVITALDGWEIRDKNKPPTDTYNLSFSKYPNLKVINNTLLYNSIPEDMKYMWNSIKSDPFFVRGVGALEIEASSDIDTDLIPHFKISFYDLIGNELDTKFIYTDFSGKVKNIIRVPGDTAIAIFSIWTVSKIDSPVSYKIQNLVVKNVSDNVTPINIKFRADPKCTAECSIYTRVLKSTKGGVIKFNVAGTSYEIQTLEKTYHERYTWIKVGSIFISGAGKKTFELTNISGINSLNAIVFLSSEESEILKENIEKTEIKVISSSSTLSKYPITSKANLINIIQTSPSNYRVNTNGNTNNKVIGFAKPYSHNWTLNNQEASQINGFTNGFLLKQKYSTFNIYYKPQQYFILGSLISSLTLLIVITFLGIYFFKDRKQKLNS